MLLIAKSNIKTRSFLHHKKLRAWSLSSELATLLKEVFASWAINTWSYGVVAALRTLNPATRVRPSVGPPFFYFLSHYIDNLT